MIKKSLLFFLQILKACLFDTSPHKILGFEFLSASLGFHGLPFFTFKIITKLAVRWPIRAKHNSIPVLKHNNLLKNTTIFSRTQQSFREHNNRFGNTTVVFHLILLCFSLRLCIRKFYCVLEKIVVHQENSLYSEKDCCVPESILVFSKRLLCSRKDCCVLKKIVVFWKRLLRCPKDCCVLKKIVAFQNRNWVVFCPYGPPYPDTPPT